MKKIPLFVIAMTFLVLASSYLGFVSASSTYYSCYMDSPYHCNSYKPYVAGDYCANYCDNLVSTQKYMGNRVDAVYNCMVKCNKGNNGGNILFNKRLSGKTGLGLNYKF